MPTMKEHLEIRDKAIHSLIGMVLAYDKDDVDVSEFKAKEREMSKCLDAYYEVMNQSPVDDVTVSGNFLVVRDDDDETERVICCDNSRQMFHRYANYKAFSDILSEHVVRAVADGAPVEYVGWMPGMEFSFCDKRTGEIVHTEFHDEWDH